MAQQRTKALEWAMIEPWAAPLLLAIAVLAFYALPLFSADASIQGDTLDVQYPLQRYFAEHLHSGHLPFWTPYILSGYPLLANPETQAWYLPHWPFYLFWLTPRAVQFELAGNALIACLGAYLFFRRTVNRSFAAVLGALAYGLSGYFAAHSSQIALFAAAAWFPWLLWSFRVAIDRSALSGIALGGLAGAAMTLAGYLPATLFGFAGLCCYAACCALTERRLPIRLLAVLLGMALLAVSISAVQLVPAIELVRYSRLSQDYSSETLRLVHLFTLALPDAAGGIAGKDSGSLANHYFYGGLLLLPLAVNGLRKRTAALAAGALIVPTVWYMLGPSAGLYRLGELIPGLQQMGPPNAAWFVAAFGLAWLAACGSERLFGRFAAAGVAIAALFFGDLWYWNVFVNRMAYARLSPDTMLEEHLERTLVSRQPALTRFDAPGPLGGVGPKLFPLYTKFETTTGYVSFKPEIYSEYARAISLNPRLPDGLNVLRYLDPGGTIQFSANPMPRAYFPKSVRGVGSEEESRRALATLSPADQSVVLAPNYILHQDSDSDTFISAYDEQSYAIHYRVRSPNLMKIAMAWYPGWRAGVAGRPLPVLRVDHALVGVVVPPGEGTLELKFSPRYFPPAAALSLAALVAASFLLWGRLLWARLTMQPV